MIRSSVDLPHPDGPIREMNSRSPISRSIPWSATTPPVPNSFLTFDRRDDAHATCSGARRTTIRSATTTIRKNVIPSSAAMRFVAQRLGGEVA